MTEDKENMENLAPMGDMIEMLIKALVSSPDKVKVFEDKDGEKTHFSVSVAQEDIGQVIGRGGRTVEAIRSIIRFCGLKRKEQFYFKVLDDSERIHDMEKSDGDDNDFKENAVSEDSSDEEKGKEDDTD